MSSDDVVFDAQCAGLLVKAMLPDLQYRRRCRGGKQGNASAKEHRNHSNFHAVNQGGAKGADLPDLGIVCRLQESVSLAGVRYLR